VIRSFPLADDNQTKKMIQLHQENVRNPLFASNNPTTSQRFLIPSNKPVSLSLATDAGSTWNPLLIGPEIVTEQSNWCGRSCFDGPTLAAPRPRTMFLSVRTRRST
jgi:hypothetical protein